MKTFTVVRRADESGVSGTGRILDGIIFHNGKVVVCWRTDVDGTKHGDSSIGVYESFGAFRRIHIDSHPSNNTEIHYNPETNELLDELTDNILFQQVDEMDLPIPKETPEGKKLGMTSRLRYKVAQYLQSKKIPIDTPITEQESQENGS